MREVCKFRRDKTDDAMTRLACQMTDDFDAPWYGTYKLSPDEPDPTPDSGLYSPKIYVRLPAPSVAMER